MGFAGWDIGNLDRIQIVKGWLGEEGLARERVYHLAWSDADRRAIDANGRLTPVDRLRSAALRRRDGGRRAHHAPGVGLDLADLVQSAVSDLIA